MNYPAAFGWLQGVIGSIAIDCKHASRKIDGKELALRLMAAIDEAIEHGEKFDRDGNPIVGVEP